MNPALWLERAAKLHPDNPALLSGTKCVADYRMFAENALAISVNLREKYHIKEGDRVALFAGNSTGYLEALYGIWWSGAVAVPINAKLHPKEAEWIMENAQADFLFTSTELSKNLSAISSPHLEKSICLECDDFAEMKRSAHPITLSDNPPASQATDDLAWLFYTSGTTGKPKGVMISCGNIHAMAFSYFVDVDTVSPTDTAFYAAPLSHGAGIYNFMHVMKAARHALPVSGGFDPAEILDVGKKLGNLHLFAAPTMVRRLVDAAKDSSETGEGIKTVVYGGGPMYLADIIEAVDIMGNRFCQIYGQGESPMCITALPKDMVTDRNHPRWRERLQSVGSAQSCVEIKIAGTDGQALPVGETGEILVRGAPVMLGYWRNEDASAKAIRDGWLWTGDMGALDEDGFLTLKDRSKDLIISGGSNVYPREVEEVLLTHPAVHEVSVVGKPDPEWGERVVAFVCPADGSDVTSEELDAHCLDLIARFKRPKEYRFISALPKNNYGKVLKTELRKML